MDKQIAVYSFNGILLFNKMNKLVIQNTIGIKFKSVRETKETNHKRLHTV